MSAMTDTGSIAGDEPAAAADAAAIDLVGLVQLLAERITGLRCVYDPTQPLIQFDAVATEDGDRIVVEVRVLPFVDGVELHRSVVLHVAAVEPAGVATAGAHSAWVAP